MTETELIEAGYSLTTALGGYKYYERGSNPTSVILYPDGVARIAVYSSQHTNPGELLRDLALKRVLELVVQLPGVVNYPLVVAELTAISDNLAVYGVTI